MSCLKHNANHTHLSASHQATLTSPSPETNYSLIIFSHMSGLSLGISLCHKTGEGVDSAGWVGINSSRGGSL